MLQRPSGCPCATTGLIPRRNLASVRLAKRWKVTSGDLHDRYSGRIMRFSDGPENGLQVQNDLMCSSSVLRPHSAC